MNETQNGRKSKPNFVKLYFIHFYSLLVLVILMVVVFFYYYFSHLCIIYLAFHNFFKTTSLFGFGVFVENLMNHYKCNLYFFYYFEIKPPNDLLYSLFGCNPIKVQNVWCFFYIYLVVCETWRITYNVLNIVLCFILGAIHIRSCALSCSHVIVYFNSVSFLSIENCHLVSPKNLKTRPCVLCYKRSCFFFSTYFRNKFSI